MADQGSADSSAKSRRKSRFDDPNPSKRPGFQDQSGPPWSAQGTPNSLHTGHKPQGAGFHNGSMPVAQPFNLQNGGFQGAPPPLVHPPPVGFVPNPQLFQQQPMPYPPHLQPVFPPQFPVGQFPPPVYIPPPSPVNVGELKDKEDLDSCNVGVMASALIKLKSKGDFEPYKPIEDPADIPNRATSRQAPQVGLVQRNRIEDFYDELEEIFEQHRAEIDPNDGKYDYSRRRKYNVSRPLTQPIKILTPDEIVNPAKRDFYASEIYGSGPKESAGLGSGEDLFESFRRKRSSKYHENYAIREAVRKDPNCIVISPSEVCYSCNKPGHFAKDCKYGIY